MINVKTTYTLGICTMGSSSAALFKNGVLIQLLRKKDFQKETIIVSSLAIEEVLDIEGIFKKY